MWSVRLTFGSDAMKTYNVELVVCTRLLQFRGPV